MNKQIVSFDLSSFKRAFLFTILAVTIVILFIPQTKVYNIKLWRVNRKNFFFNFKQENKTSFNLTVNSSPFNIILNVLKNNKTKLNQTDSCPLIAANLTSRITIDTTIYDFKRIEDMLQHLPINRGGLSSPTECKSNKNIAIIVPFRNRESNLKIFLKYIHPLLVKQQLNYGIYLVEPIQNITFNRGLLMNIGFMESLRLSSNQWDCFIFHDVDLIPEDERNMYICSEEPRHMSSSVSTFNYKLPYDAIFGGVCALNKTHMETINGFSNIFFGWGGEDDDLRLRLIRKEFKIARYPLDIGRYLMTYHDKDTNINTKRFTYLNDTYKRMQKDGLNSLRYQIEDIELKPLYTKILVNYNQTELVSDNY